jgi:hypothetical protein
VYVPEVLYCINPLNAELNPICHLLILLGDLTFMSTCIVSIFQYISNKMQRYTVFCVLLSLTPHSLLQALEDGTDTWFRNVGKLHIDAGEIPKRTYTITQFIYIWKLHVSGGTFTHHQERIHLYLQHLLFHDSGR